MKEHYTYDEIYGTLLSKNEDDSERVYFVIECQYHTFYSWMFSHGWNKVKDRQCERNELKGFEVILRTNRHGV